MTKLFESTRDFPFLRWGEGFLIGIILMLCIAATLPKPEPVVVKVPVVQVIEKPVLVKKPIYLNQYDKQQIQCLTENAYYEAGNQTQQGKIAVTNVVMNRVNDSRFPKTPCGVVKQKKGGVCQFSWACQHNKHISDMHVYAAARKAAEDVYLQNIGDVTRGAKFYHAHYVRPQWASVFRRTTIIGDHIFYKG